MPRNLSSECLELSRQGLTPTEISKKLGIAINRASYHVTKGESDALKESRMQKLRALSMKAGLIKPTTQATP